MYRTLLALVVAFATALGLVGLTFSASTKDPRADFVIVNGTEPQSLDPHKAKGAPEGRLLDMIFEGLTRKDPRTFEPVAGAASSWAVSPDGRRWTFTIRGDARWSDGSPVTAHDFAYAWRRLQEPKTASEYSAVLHVVRHARALNKYGAQVKALRGDPKAERPEARAGVVARFRALAGQGGGGVPFAALSTFLVETDLRNVVSGTKAAALIDVFARTAGDLSPDEASAVADALAAEAEARSAALAVADERFGRTEGAFATDERTFVVELESVAPYFLELTAFYVTYPVPRSAVERHRGAWFREGRIVGNGPFCMTAWRVNEKIRLERSPTYWGAADVSLRTIDVLPHDNQTTALNLYLTGAADFLPGNYPGDLVDRLKSRPDFHSSPGMIVYFYRFNTTRPPFDDVRVRKALAKCVDRETVVRDLTRKGELPTTTIVPGGVPDYESPGNDLGFDPEAARRLLAEAGYGPGGKPFRRFTIVYNTHEQHKKIAEFVAGQWKQHLGIDAVAQNKEWQALLADVAKLEYDVQRAGWIGDYRDPKTFLDMWITGDGNNETGWSDATYDRFVALASEADRFAVAPQAEVDGVVARCREQDEMRAAVAAVREAADPSRRLEAVLALRRQLFREAEARLLNDGVPILPFYFYVVTGMVAPDVEGIRYWGEVDGRRIPNLQDDHPLRDVTTARSRAARPAPAPEGPR